MKDQVLKLNSGSIEKIEILEDRIEFFPSQLCWHEGKTWRNREFNGQLRVKLYKYKTKNQNKKARKVKCGIDVFMWIKLHKFKSLKPIRSAIRMITNWGTKTHLHLLSKLQSHCHCSHAAHLHIVYVGKLLQR